MTLSQLLNQRLSAALAAAGCPDASPILQTASRPEFGDYQANGIMAAAKAKKTNPRALAEQVIAQLDLAGIASKIEIAGPGFINIHLDPAFLAGKVSAALASPSLGIEPQSPRQKVIVDYSSPNLAKEMHVGHLRSSIIGDALVRVLAAIGHDTIRCNHVGDWGTQFGMLTAYLVESENQDTGLALNDLEDFYRKAKIRFDEDAAFADRARDYVVRLQSGDAEVLALWKQFVDVSLTHCEAVYRKLGVSLTRADARGESAYNADLPVIVRELREKGLLAEDDGAQVVFLEEFRNQDGDPMGVIIQKKDGGYLYTTTDLGAVRYRCRELGVDRVLYVVDARQSQHFQQVFTLCRKAGFAPENVQLQHIGFGTMMGEDGKPFKTRSGGTVKLIELLDEAEERAFQLVSEKNPDLDDAARRRVALAVGIGAVKYADLSKNRNSDYIFNWDQMLAFEGNTAPYLQYAYTRVASLFRKAGEHDANAPVQIDAAEEKALAVALAQFNDVLYHVADEGYPHFLCQYLYQVSTLFMRFYEACPVLKSEGAVRASRLQLARLTAATLKTGLDLLGIEVLEAM